MIEIFYLDKSIKKADIKDLSKVVKKKLWIDATKITPQEAGLLQRTFKLHPVTTEDLLSTSGRIKVEEFPDYLFCTFFSLANDAHNIKLATLHFVIGDDFIISAHNLARENIETLKRETGQLAILMKEGVESVFHRLLDMEIDEFFPVLEILDDEIEALNEHISLTGDTNLLSDILATKRKVVEIKKITFPQREKIGFLAKRRYKFIPSSSLPYFRDIYDEAIRVYDIIENYREAITSTFEAYMTKVSQSTNEVMKVLSIIATVALPLTVVSGIYGTNFRGLPGSESPIGFWVMVGVMALLVFGMIFYFKKKRWF
ncbi:MAG: magnesium/cobalt transporter CorA [Nanoarchaeota archaeon]|nr:magnesium/cobalt transporter CorA [Nanoarchaeota archaeon]MBU1704069.1 magnesium/cobalt transporter CorA [Nanoarchaeota archaeon]